MKIRHEGILFIVFIHLEKLTRVIHLETVLLKMIRLLKIDEVSGGGGGGGRFYIPSLFPKMSQKS